MWFIVESKLKELECPIQLTDGSLFCALFIVLQGGVFEQLNEFVDLELHSLIKSVPEILLSQYMAESYENFTENLESEQINLPSDSLTLEEI